MAIGAFIGSRLMGALTLGVGPLNAHSLVEGATLDDCLTLTRFWLSDELPRNSESRYIGIVLRSLKRHTGLKFLSATPTRPRVTWGPSTRLPAGPIPASPKRCPCMTWAMQSPTLPKPEPRLRHPLPGAFLQARRPGETGAPAGQAPVYLFLGSNLAGAALRVCPSLFQG